jgi:hypothetical protein
VHQVLGGNADPRVLYLQKRLFVLLRCAHLDTTPWSIVVDGVVQQREDGLFEECRITNHHGSLVGVYLNADLRLASERLHPPYSPLSLFSKVYHLVLLMGGTAVQASKGQQVVGQVGHLVRFGHDIL